MFNPDKLDAIADGRARMQPAGHPSRSKLYRKAVDWIAANDETGEQSAAVMATMISVLLTADLFELSAQRVADDVIMARGR